MLRSYSLPNFHHLPIWKNEPTDIEINQGETTKINCSAVVGPQYNSIKLQPVRAYWKNFQVKKKNSKWKSQCFICASYCFIWVAIYSQIRLCMQNILILIISYYLITTVISEITDQNIVIWE